MRLVGVGDIGDGLAVAQLLRRVFAVMLGEVQDERIPRHLSVERPLAVEAMLPVDAAPK